MPDVKKVTHELIKIYLNTSFVVNTIKNNC
jgi:hypothetical protein